MAANMTNWLENLSTQAANGQATLPQLGSQIYLRFHTGAPGEDGTANPLASGGGYNIQGVPVTYSDISTFTINNTAFTVTNTPAATITHVTLWDGTTNVWFWGTYSKTFEAGKDLEFSGGEFPVLLQGNMTQFFAQKISDAFRNVASYINTTPKFASFTVDPGLTGDVGANEEDDVNYARATPGGWGSVTDGVQATNAVTELGTAFAGASTCAKFAMVDENETPDKLLYVVSPTGAPLSISAGDILRVPSGSGVVTST